jgi:hypothetical protein
MSTEIYELTVDEHSSVAGGGIAGIESQEPGGQPMGTDYPMIENNPPG